MIVYVFQEFLEKGNLISTSVVKNVKEKFECNQFGYIWLHTGPGVLIITAAQFYYNYKVTKYIFQNQNKVTNKRSLKKIVIVLKGFSKLLRISISKNLPTNYLRRFKKTLRTIQVRLPTYIFKNHCSIQTGHNIVSCRVEGTIVI